MRIGFDVDGILAAFIPAYQNLVIQTAGHDMFLPGDDVNPPCWDWPEFRGYDKATVRKVWQTITSGSTFWQSLTPLDGVAELNAVAEQLIKHDVYFITSRPGVLAKQQTENWLIQHTGFFNPTVLISSDKGACCKALNLDAYIDDKLDNIYDVVVESPETRLYCLGMRYNQDDNPVAPRYYTRVSSLAEMLALESERL